MHTFPTAALAQQHRADLIAQADHHRAVRLARAARSARPAATIPSGPTHTPLARLRRSFRAAI